MVRLNANLASRNHASSALLAIDAEDERQKEALRKFYHRERLRKVPAPTLRALLIVFGIFFFGVLGVLAALNTVTFGR